MCVCVCVCIYIIQIIQVNSLLPISPICRWKNTSIFETYLHSKVITISRQISPTFLTILLAIQLLSAFLPCGCVYQGLPDDSVVKSPRVSAGDTRDVGSIPGFRRSPGGGNGNPLQYSCLKNPMDRGAW